MLTSVLLWFYVAFIGPTMTPNIRHFTDPVTCAASYFAATYDPTVYGLSGNPNDVGVDGSDGTGCSWTSSYLMITRP